jgi:hypothetical protein
MNRKFTLAQYGIIPHFVFVRITSNFLLRIQISPGKYSVNFASREEQSITFLVRDIAANYWGSYNYT